ncbi:hypothetical protein CYMTET_50915 [Cymbomonas tetramitiformis]|uniref:Uncharacterized protein n=1 Tax=Cymbomonas tetramitiformis TaxID=36881 RepID=A0AAE0BMB4_9CHLO|nr:hypothetical protein CYMTET_50915 [Cymbomonas tetramitiformis]
MRPQFNQSGVERMGYTPQSLQEGNLVGLTKDLNESPEMSDSEDERQDDTPKFPQAKRQSEQNRHKDSVRTRAERLLQNLQSISALGDTTATPRGFPAASSQESGQQVAPQPPGASPAPTPFTTPAAGTGMSFFRSGAGLQPHVAGSKCRTQAAGSSGGCRSNNDSALTEVVQELRNRIGLPLPTPATPSPPGHSASATRLSAAFSASVHASAAGSPEGLPQQMAAPTHITEDSHRRLLQGGRGLPADIAGSTSSTIRPAHGSVHPDVLQGSSLQEELKSMNEPQIIDHLRRQKEILQREIKQSLEVEHTMLYGAEDEADPTRMVTPLRELEGMRGGELWGSAQFSRESMGHMLALPAPPAATAPLSSAHSPQQLLQTVPPRGGPSSMAEGVSGRFVSMAQSSSHSSSASERKPKNEGLAAEITHLQKELRALNMKEEQLLGAVSIAARLPGRQQTQSMEQRSWASTPGDGCTTPKDASAISDTSTGIGEPGDTIRGQRRIDSDITGTSGTWGRTPPGSAALWTPQRTVLTGHDEARFSQMTDQERIRHWRLERERVLRELQYSQAHPASRPRATAQEEIL